MTGPTAKPEPLVSNGRSALVAVALLSVAGLIAQLAGGGGDSSAAVATDAVRTAALACPAPVVRVPGAASTVTLAAPPAFPGPASPSVGTAVLADLGGSKVRAKLTTVGFVGLDTAPPTVPAQVARGVAGLAPGLAAELLTQARSGPGRGLAAVSCLIPGTRFAFVGASTAAGRRDRLVLTNADATPAVLDLRLWSDKGPVDAPNSTDITVPAESVREIPLDGLSAGRVRLAVAVNVTRGRVAAAVHDQDSPGIDAHGIDWIAPATEPSRRIVIAGVPDGKLARRLQLIAPGEADAIVKVRLLTKDNDFVPAGVDTLALEAGKVAEFDLTKAADSQAVAVVIDSDQPVLAAVRVTRSAGPVADVAFATAATALSTPATVADGRTGGPNALTQLMLTAPDGPASVHVRPLLRTGPGKETVVTIAAGRTVLINPGPKNVARYGVVVTPAPGSSPVYAARILRAGSTDLTITPLLSGRYTVAIPSVVADLTATTDRR